MIGWEHETLQFDESVGQVHICLCILQGTLYIFLNVTTRDGTASRAGQGFQQDYIPDLLPQYFPLFPPMSSDSHCTNNLPIIIVDDATLDSAVNETFLLTSH